MNFSDKFVKKYMRIAKVVGEDQNPCYSRHIGVVIVSPVSNRILGTGYNGPAPKTPHCDSEEYLRTFFWPKLSVLEKAALTEKYNLISDDDFGAGYEFAGKAAECKTCPRRLIDAPSGERSELCSCGHAERHAITNAACELAGASMFCWCGVPCIQCTDSIIQAGIKEVYALEVSGPDYHQGCRWLFEKAGVQLYLFCPEHIDPSIRAYKANL